MSGRVFWIGPESAVYHLSARCPRLSNAGRYYPRHDALTHSQEARRIVATRRPCKVCAAP